MKRRIRVLVPVFGAALLLTTAIAAQAASSQTNAQAAAQAGLQTNKPAAPATTSPAFGESGGYGVTSLCYTCGNDFPVFEGYVESYPSVAYERGSGCSGGFTTANNDHYPYLCSR